MDPKTLTAALNDALTLLDKLSALTDEMQALVTCNYNPDTPPRTDL